MTLNQLQNYEIILSYQIWLSALIVESDIFPRCHTELCIRLARGY